jgi:hypothetical protein
MASNEYRAPSAAATLYPSDLRTLREPRTAVDEDDDESGDSDPHAIVVDWRADDREVVEQFAERLVPGDTLTTRHDDSGLYATYNGTEFRIPLTESGADRYVTICSLMSILSARYELRRFTYSIGSDTHSFLLLLREDWARLDKESRNWARSTFEPVRLGEDGFGGGEIPYTELPRSKGDGQPWWRFW